ncbi:MAG: hypothetical protein WA741_17010 [Candidatus Sulfotelmatobacter sp.]
MNRPQPRLGFSKKRLALAFALAVLSDGLSFFLTFTPPFQWALDLVTALLLFIVLGWHWVMLPGLILEAIPGVNIFPFWLLVVGAVALLGSARPNPKALLHASQEVGKSFWQRLSGQAHRPSNLPDSKEVPHETGSPDPKV